MGMVRDNQEEPDNHGEDDAECRLLKEALAAHDGNVLEAAQALGMSREVLLRNLRRHGVADAF